jgi:hypothetical protein
VNVVFALLPFHVQRGAPFAQVGFVSFFQTPTAVTVLKSTVLKSTVLKAQCWKKVITVLKKNNQYQLKQVNQNQSVYMHYMYYMHHEREH